MRDRYFKAVECPHCEGGTFHICGKHVRHVADCGKYIRCGECDGKGYTLVEITVRPVRVTLQVEQEPEEFLAPFDPNQMVFTRPQRVMFYVNDQPALEFTSGECVTVHSTELLALVNGALLVTP